MNKWFSQTVNELEEEIIKEYNSIEDFPEGTYGFVYIVTHTPTNKAYIGKKALNHNITKKLGKKEIAEQKGPGRKALSKKVIKESDWKTYHGSSKHIIEMIKAGKENEFTREILILAKDKKLLTYWETKLLFGLEVLEHPDLYFNDNILGSFYSKDFTK